MRGSALTAEINGQDLKRRLHASIIASMRTNAERLSIKENETSEKYLANS